MSSHAGLNQPTAVAFLKVRVPYDRVEGESEALAVVRRYLYAGQTFMSTLDDTDLDRVAWVITVVVPDWGHLSSFKSHGVQSQVDRFASSGWLVVTESTVYTPEQV